MPSSDESQKIPRTFKFFLGGMSGIFTQTILQPLDVINRRIELAHNKVAASVIIKNIIRQEGIAVFYTGLRFTLFRQVTYATTRLGVYAYLFDDYRLKQKKHPGFLMKMSFGIIAGTAGAVVGMPAETCINQITKNILTEQKCYKKGIKCILMKIVKERGVLALWRGAKLSIFRAIVMNTSQLVTYSQTREMLGPHINKGVFLYFISSLVSGLITTITIMPVDVIKTRIQTTKSNKSWLVIIKKQLYKKPFLSMWKGFLSYYVRMGSHTTLLFVTLQELYVLHHRLSQRL